MPRVLVVCPFLFTNENGNRRVNSIKDTVIYNLCIGFTKNGWQPVLISDIQFRPVEKEEYPFEILFLKTRLEYLFPPNRFPFPIGLRKYLKMNRDKFDFVISSEVFMFTSLITRIYVKKKLIVWQELGEHNKMMYKLASKLWYNLIGRTFFRNTTVVPRSITAQKFISKYCKNTSKTIIDNSISTDHLRASREKDNYFISVTQLIKRKQVNTIIDKFYQFYKENKEYKLYICGEGDERENLCLQIKELGLENIIQLLGQIPHEKLGILWSRAAATLVNTSKDINMVCIIESIACGTPVITNRVPYSASVIVENELGIVSDEWNANTLKQLLNNMDLYIDNCLSYRDNLTNEHIAYLFIKTYLKK